MEPISSEFFLQQSNLFPGFPILLSQAPFLPPLQDPTRQFQFALRPKSPQSSPTLRGATGMSTPMSPLRNQQALDQGAGDRREGLQTPSKKRNCNCKNSRCLKLYCECFASGAYCDQCNCRGCCNDRNHDRQRQEAVELTLERNPAAFRPKILNSPYAAPKAAEDSVYCNSKCTDTMSQIVDNAHTKTIDPHTFIRLELLGKFTIADVIAKNPIVSKSTVNAINRTCCVPKCVNARTARILKEVPSRRARIFWRVLHLSSS